MSNNNQVYIYCAQCKHCIRTDDGSYCEHYLTKGRSHSNSESSMVIFRYADGRTSIPWSPDAKVPNGAVREEIKGARAVRKLEREMDAKDLSKHRHYQEKLERMMAPINSSMREGLRRQMANARSTFERDYARAALDRLERKPSDRNWEAGNHRD